MKREKGRRKKMKGIMAKQNKKVREMETKEKEKRTKTKKIIIKGKR
jgi:hypothetical protein